MIPLAEPCLTGNEAEYTRQAIASGWVSGGGPFVERFEAMVAEACGRKWCVATLTGSAALHLALTAAGCRRGMQVSMPSMAYIASANAVNLKGGVIRFVDTERDWSYDRTSLGGVIDAAPAVGVKQDGLLLCLSFNGNKTVTTGQGGAVVGDDAKGEGIVRHLANVAKLGNYEHDAIGFNYRMPNLNAAMGVAQMERLPEFMLKKRQIWNRYREAGLDMLESKSCWMSVAKAQERTKTLADLMAEGIAARPFWKPLHLQEPYKACKRNLLPETVAVWGKLICLPCSVSLTTDDQDKVLRCISR